MLWDIEIRPAAGRPDREAARVLAGSTALRAGTIRDVQAVRSFLVQGALTAVEIDRIGRELLVDTVVEEFRYRELSGPAEPANGRMVLNVLYKPGVTDNVALSTKIALQELGWPVQAVATCRKYLVNSEAVESELRLWAGKVLANDAIEHVVWGPLQTETLALGHEYRFQLRKVPIRELDHAELMQLSKTGQLYLSLAEMQTIQRHFIELQREPTDAELETIAQTWSEHCSHKTLAGRVQYRDDTRTIFFENMLKETIFAATQSIRKKLGADDWCVSVFRDNAGIVTFDERQNVCIKVETHNHPSALEPYGGANTGLGGVIRDPLGTGLGGRPVCNTDVFCFAPPDTPYEALPPGTLHPQTVARGVVSGVRDYGNRMGIPTVNGAIFFDERYLGNPLVFCGNVAMIPVGMSEKTVQPRDLIVAVGGRTGRDGIHGATFSSAELTEESETLSGGAVQIGNAITEKMLADVILAARDLGLYTAITDCGAGGFSSAVGEMGEEHGADVWLDQAPLKYQGLSYTEVWISEAQERMVLCVPPANWDAFQKLCAAEGVEATIIGRFRDDRRLMLYYQGHLVADLAMEFLHEGRPPVIREAVYQPPAIQPLSALPAGKTRFDEDLLRILGSLNVCSKEWVIRQYDHEVQAGSVVKPLVGVMMDGPSDAAVVRPDLKSNRGLVVANGMNPRYGDLDPYWMAAAAIDEAVRNAVAVGADPQRIAILDNFCWGNTERPETLGSLVRAAIACKETALAYGTPFVSGKDSLNNEFSYFDDNGQKQTVAIPPSLLISALGQIPDVRQAVTMDLKAAGNRLFLIGVTKDEMGGSHYALVNGLTGGQVPQVDFELAPRIFIALHLNQRAGQIRSCHDLSEGGLAVTLAEMAFAGGFGVEVSLQGMTDSLSVDRRLFSESTTRFVIEVVPEHAAAIRTAFADLPCLELGQVTDDGRVRIADGKGLVIDSSIADLKRAWQAPLAWD